jgi:hypothetical protein
MSKFMTSTLIQKNKKYKLKHINNWFNLLIGHQNKELLIEQIMRMY